MDVMLWLFDYPLIPFVCIAVVLVAVFWWMAE